MFIKQSRYDELARAEELLNALVKQLRAIRDRGQDDFHSREIEVPDDPHFCGLIDGGLWEAVLVHTHINKK